LPSWAPSSLFDLANAISILDAFSDLLDPANQKQYEQYSQLGRQAWQTIQSVNVGNILSTAAQAAKLLNLFQGRGREVGDGFRIIG
jgi:hypothetical protein